MKIGVLGTGDVGRVLGKGLSDLGHEVKINLTWDNEKHQFIGKWYVNTHKYQGEDLYELTNVKQSSIHQPEESQV